MRGATTGACERRVAATSAPAGAVALVTRAPGVRRLTLPARGGVPLYEESKMQGPTISSVATSLLLPLALACGPDTTSPPPAPTTSASDTGEEGTTGAMTAPCEEMAFTNRIDQAACPEIRGQGVAVVLADKVELCRRLHVDLLGFSPSAAEFEENCKWSSPPELVDDFMMRPDYIRVNQRAWADTFRMTSALTFYPYIADLDAMVGELYAGATTLDQFAGVAATHPGFTGRFDGNDLVGYNFQAYLGRDAIPSERLALEPLWHMWEERPATDALASVTSRVVLNTLRCQGVDEADCHSDFWGDESVVIPAPVPGNLDPNGPNVLALEQIADVDWLKLRKPGQLIAQQAAFYESYVDRRLRRYLGYDAGADLPRVRQALVGLMEETHGDVRSLDREILTSVLYQMTSAHDEADDVGEEDWDPAYWHGPIKQMDGEDWLASAARLTGVDLGSCDHRYPVVQSGVSGFHPNSYPKNPDSSPNYGFRDRAQLLGGCPDRVAAFREIRTGLVAALTQSTLTDELCAAAGAGAPIFPAGLVVDPDDKSVETLASIARFIYSAALVRPIPGGAEAALEKSVDLCRDDVNCLPAVFAAETCRAVLKSADFLFY